MPKIAVPTLMEVVYRFDKPSVKVTFEPSSPNSPYKWDVFVTSLTNYTRFWETNRGPSRDNAAYFIKLFEQQPPSEKV